MSSEAPRFDFEVSGRDVTFELANENEFRRAELSRYVVTSKLKTGKYFQLKKSSLIKFAPVVA